MQGIVRLAADSDSLSYDCAGLLSNVHPEGHAEGLGAVVRAAALLVSEVILFFVFSLVKQDLPAHCHSRSSIITCGHA